MEILNGWRIKDAKENTRTRARNNFLLDNSEILSLIFIHWFLVQFQGTYCQPHIKQSMIDFNKQVRCSPFGSRKYEPDELTLKGYSSYFKRRWPIFSIFHTEDLVPVQTISWFQCIVPSILTFILYLFYVIYCYYITGSYSFHLVVLHLYHVLSSFYPYPRAEMFSLLKSHYIIQEI